MSVTAAQLILAVCGAIAILLIAPFLFFAHRRRKSRTTTKPGSVQKTVPLRDLPAIAAYVCVMFFGFAHAYIAPDTWFGRQMATNLGRVEFLALPAMIILIVRAAWAQVQLARRRQGSTAAPPADEDA
jgi:hypothetical protein